MLFESEFCVWFLNLKCVIQMTSEAATVSSFSLAKQLSVALKTRMEVEQFFTNVTCLN